MNNPTFEKLASAFRENTGSSLLDSGGAYGRHHQKPEIPRLDNPVRLEIYTGSHGVDITATIEVANFLAERCELATVETIAPEWAEDPSDEPAERDLNEFFLEYVDVHPNTDYFDDGPDFMSSLGYTQAARDNTYNGESDLSQCYVWEVYLPGSSEGEDWIWCDDAVFVIYPHTGCDVRGGYAGPVFLAHDGDYSLPVDIVAQYGISEGRAANGNEMTLDEMQRLSECWQNGYSDYPSGQLSEDVERVFFADRTEKLGYVLALLKTGERVKIHGGTPYCH